MRMVLGFNGRGLVLKVLAPRILETSKPYLIRFAIS
jgi:hypothetical protein